MTETRGNGRPNGVPGQVIRALVVAMERLHARPERLLARAGIEANFFREPSATLDWESFVIFLEGFAAGRSDLEIEHLGIEFAAALPALRTLAGMLLPVGALFRFLVGPSERMLWPMVSTEVVPIGGAYEVSMTLEEGIAPCRSFFPFRTGVLRSFPRLVGLEDARVSALDVTDRSAHWRVSLPAQRLLLPEPPEEQIAEMYAEAIEEVLAFTLTTHPPALPDPPEMLGRLADLTETEIRIVRRLEIHRSTATAAEELAMKVGTVRAAVTRLKKRITAAKRQGKSPPLWAPVLLEAT